MDGGVPEVSGTLSASMGGRGGHPNNANDQPLVAETLRSHPRPGSNAVGAIVAHTLRGDGHDASEDGSARGTPIIPFDTTQITSKDNRCQPKAGPCHPIAAHGHPPTIAMQERMESLNPEKGPHGKGWRDDGAAFTLEARRKPQAIAFTSKDHGSDASEDVAPTLRAGEHDESHANAGAPPAIAFDPRQHPCVYEEHTGAHGAEFPRHAVAVSIRGREGGATAETHEGASPAIRASQDGGDKPHVMVSVRRGDGNHRSSSETIGPLDTEAHTNVLGNGMTVRRLTPLECERLQGFPDGHTAVPHRGKPMADGPRYKLLGNSMAVNCMRWIGERIALFERVARR